MTDLCVNFLSELLLTLTISHITAVLSPGRLLQCSVVQCCCDVVNTDDLTSQPTQSPTLQHSLPVTSHLELSSQQQVLSRVI